MLSITLKLKKNNGIRTDQHT